MPDLPPMIRTCRPEKCAPSPGPGSAASLPPKLRPEASRDGDAVEVGDLIPASAGLNRRTKPRITASGAGPHHHRPAGRRRRTCRPSVTRCSLPSAASAMRPLALRSCWPPPRFCSAFSSHHLPLPHLTHFSIPSLPSLSLSSRASCATALLLTLLELAAITFTDAPSSTSHACSPNCQCLRRVLYNPVSRSFATSHTNPDLLPRCPARAAALRAALTPCCYHLILRYRPPLRRPLPRHLHSPALLPPAAGQVCPVASASLRTAIVLFVAPPAALVRQPRSAHRRELHRRRASLHALAFDSAWRAGCRRLLRARSYHFTADAARPRRFTGHRCDLLRLLRHRSAIAALALFSHPLTASATYRRGPAQPCGHRPERRCAWSVNGKSEAVSDPSP